MFLFVFLLLWVIKHICISFAMNYLFMYFVHFSIGYRNTLYNSKNGPFLRNKCQNFFSVCHVFWLFLRCFTGLFFVCWVAFFVCFVSLAMQTFFISNWSIFIKLLFYYLLLLGILDLERTSPLLDYFENPSMVSS